MRPGMMGALASVAMVVAMAAAAYGLTPQQIQQQQAEQLRQQQQAEQARQQQLQQQEADRQKQLEQQRQQQGDSSTTTTSKTSATVFIVIKVTNTKGETSYDVIQSSALVSRQKAMAAEYKAAQEKWKKDKAAALDAKKTFDEKQPVEGKVERVETDPPGFKTQPLAKAEADKLTKKMEDAKKAAATAPAGSSAPKPAAHTPPTGMVVKTADTPKEGDAATDNKGPADKNP